MLRRCLANDFTDRRSFRRRHHTDDDAERNIGREAITRPETWDLSPRAAASRHKIRAKEWARKDRAWLVVKKRLWASAPLSTQNDRLWAPAPLSTQNDRFATAVLGAFLALMLALFVSTGHTSSDETDADGMAARAAEAEAAARSAHLALEEMKLEHADERADLQRQLDQATSRPTAAESTEGLDQVLRIALMLAFVAVVVLGFITWDKLKRYQQRKIDEERQQQNESRLREAEAADQNARTQEERDQLAAQLEQMRNVAAENMREVAHAFAEAERAVAERQRSEAAALAAQREAAEARSQAEATQATARQDRVQLERRSSVLKAMAEHRKRQAATAERSKAQIEAAQRAAMAQIGVLSRQV